MSNAQTLTSPFTQLSNDSLLLQTKALVQQEKQTTLEILQHLREIEKRRLYLQRGYSSLFTYCTQELGYSESQAHRRVSSMRLIREIPEVEEQIAVGTLSLATVSHAQSFFRKEAKETGVERKLEEKKEVLKSLQGKSKREAEKSLVALCPQIIRQEETIRPLTAEYTKLNIILTTEQEFMLQRLKELKPDKQTTAELLEWLMQRTLKQIDPLKKKKSPNPNTRASKNKFAVQTKTRNSTQSRPFNSSHSSPSAQPTAAAATTAEPSAIHFPRDSKSGRYIPAGYRQEIWSRAEGCCEYKDKSSGRRCCEKRDLQIDHIQPLALGGKTELENLRLLCRSHNQWAAIQVFGEVKMAAYLKD